MNKYYNNEQYAMMKAAVKDVLAEKEKEEEVEEYTLFERIILIILYVLGFLIISLALIICFCALFNLYV